MRPDRKRRWHDAGTFGDGTRGCPKGHGRRKLPDHLPRKEIHHILEGDELLCPCCDKPRVKISEEVSEQLEFVPASLFVNRHIRHTCACVDEACIESSVVTAPKPAQPIEKGLPGPGLLAYARNQWESLKVFTRDGRVEIDNNRVERSIRYLVLGRHNWLFLGNGHAGHTAAVLYSLVITCKRLRMDPWAYLNDVFARLPSANALELRHLLPDHWIRAHPQHRLVHREREARSAARRQQARRAKRRREVAAATTK